MYNGFCRKERKGRKEMELNEFKCRMCGACCRIKDGIVRVSDAEIARIAAFLGMDEAEFIERETEVAPDRKSLILKSRPDGASVKFTAAPRIGIAYASKRDQNRKWCFTLKHDT